MSKLLKHLGLGGKKAPPQPPKPDYSALKSASLDSPRSPTSEKSAGMSTTSSQISGFEVGQLQGSPGHRSDKYGGARPKDMGGGGGMSPHSLQTRPSVQSFGLGDEGDAPAAGENGGSPGATAGPNATPPRLLDEYSDPADCKKQFEEMRGDGAVLPVIEDDYSVPYEVKKLFKEGAEGDSPSKRRDRYFGDTGLEEAGHADARPKEDYDEPWEWSAKTSLILQSQVETGNIPPHFLTSQTQQVNRTPQLSKRTISTSAAQGGGGDGASASPEEETDGKIEASGGVVEVVEDAYEITSSRTRTDNDPGSDDEGYTHLREEFVERPTPPDSLGRNASSSEHQKQQSKDQPKVGNYEEPWDLSAKTKELENKIKAASDRASRGDSSAKSSAVSTGDTGTPPHELDTRAQEGYEKPWDWKPHKKDDRNQEGVSGYEKPWDWKPEQKDDRPPAEYEKPWDQKAKNLEAGIVASGGSKVTKEEGRRPPEEGRRPPEEYDEPWDHKLKKHQKPDTPGNASSSDSSPKSGQSHNSPHTSPLHQGGSSPLKKQHKLNLDLGARSFSVGERIDPSIPLEQQGWYHGSISRIDAENLLRVHKEGSYLVRMSESNKLDYSLSLKSARGFMHMKIVSRDAKYILGQFSQPFDSIPLMIHHYSISKLPIKGAEHMSLLHPVINELL